VRLFTTIAGLRCYLELHRPSQHEAIEYESFPIGSAPEVGLVPTMGALHAGHLSLIQRARRENKIVVVSIFVNPLQFGPQEDFQRYPRTLEQDRQLCEQAGVDVIFAPTPDQLGITPPPPHSPTIPPPHSPTTVVPPHTMTSTLCGRSRIGHFEGVATIVTKLFNLVQPDRAYFGHKDAQQVAIIRRMVKDLDFPLEIIGCPTLRESNGLAMSSRNQYLSLEERRKAATIYRGLRLAEQAFCAGEHSARALVDIVQVEVAMEPTIAPEYVELVHPETLVPLDMVEESGLLAVAARIGATRLIDNILLSNRQPIVAIDGPAGAGKSTVARLLAEKLDLLYLDTGAMYRALTWLVLQSGITVDDEPAVAELVSQCEIEFSSREIEGRTEESKIQNQQQMHPVSKSKILINGRDVTQEIRSLEVTAQVSVIAAQPAVRAELVRQQRRFGRSGGIVIEGRDIGTHVFPDAELKIYLTASVQERARRRQQDLIDQGKGEISLEELEQAIYERDRKDSTRALAPLRKATDAIEVQTDGIGIAEVLERITQLYQAVISR
jgi:pantoate ligase/cytidylate kinase